MKQLIKILVVPILMLLVVVACEKQQHEPITSDGSIPPVIENVIVTPINGGLSITYDLPRSSDLLYVKAVYTDSSGKEAEVKTSVYDNNITILGFGDTNEKTVKLYSVDRANNNSEPVTVTGSPLTPPVFLIQQAMEITPDFGGARFTWENSSEAPVVIELMAIDKGGAIDTVKTVYTEQLATKSSLRGYESVPTKFAAVVRDRYDNFSDTIYAKTDDKLLTPLFEERIDKSKFKKVVLNNDDDWSRWDGDYWNLFDDKDETFAHTQGDHPLPSILTVDFGQVVTLSRFNVLQRRAWPFTHGNPKTYTVYGAKELPGQDGNLDDWILLRECESIKPSGSPLGTNTDEDLEHFEAGDEYSFETPIEIRYFRFAVHSTWDGAGFIDFAELTFWGSVIE